MFKSLGFREIPQELCVIINESVITFFYVDNIIIYYRKKNEANAQATIAGLQA